MHFVRYEIFFIYYRVISKISSMCIETSFLVPCLTEVWENLIVEDFELPILTVFSFGDVVSSKVTKLIDVRLYVNLWKQLLFHFLVSYRVTLLECENDNSRTINWNFPISKIILVSKLMNILLSFNRHHKFAFFLKKN